MSEIFQNGKEMTKNMSGASKNQCLGDWEYKTIEEVLVTQELNKLNRKCAQQAHLLYVVCFLDKKTYLF